MRSRGGERGAVIVEFALVLPLLMMFVFGIIEFGRGYNARIELTSGVREGARATALGGTSISPTEIQQKVRDAAPGLTASQITLSPAPTLCTGSPPPANAKVTVTYPFKYDIPFVGSQTVSLTATGVMRCGG